MDAVDTKTGEIITLPVKYDPREYLASLSRQDGLAVQKQLAAAYDAACAALVGPNDVQVEGNRSFKKKSAWRKLARYFNISVEVAKVEREMLGEHFLATVTARAVAPWGQSYEEVGACCTDEATGRRVITSADAIATASTRASNRAVSNLIAMGEVSAEEIGDRPSHGSRPARSASQGADVPARSAGKPSGDPSAFLMPFGKTKGTPLGAMDLADLKGAMDWARDKGKFPEFVAAARIVMDAGMPEPEERDPSGFPDEADDSEIPF